MEALSKYPSSERDWTMTVPESLTFNEIISHISSVPTSLLEATAFLAIYRSESLGKGTKNVTLRFVYRNREKTLEQEAVDSEHARITTEVLRRINI